MSIKLIGGLLAICCKPVITVAFIDRWCCCTAQRWTINAEPQIWLDSRKKTAQVHPAGKPGSESTVNNVTVNNDCREALKSAATHNTVEEAPFKVWHSVCVYWTHSCLLLLLDTWMRVSSSWPCRTRRLVFLRYTGMCSMFCVVWLFDMRKAALVCRNAVER